MTTQKNENQAKAKRYLVLLKDDKKSSIKKAEKDLKVKLVSSAQLDSENRAYQVMSGDTGIFYKNLNVAVVDKVPVKTLRSAVQDDDNPIVYWEEEREYRIADEFDIIDQLKNSTEEIQLRLQELEELLQANQDPPSDGWSNSTWGLKAIKMVTSTKTGKDVKVCILDTGLYKDHPDFAGRTIVGKSFIEEEDWDFDGNGHGTHCAGTAVGFESDDGKRYGVAKDAELYVGKVLSDAGSGSTSGIIDAMDWAIEKGCQVISMSLGSPVNVGENPSLIFERAGEKALENGCLVVAAAGNDSSRPSRLRPVSSPANAQSIMAIAALDSSSNIAYFSNAGLNSGTGGRIDLGAPGVDVFSSYSMNASDGHLYRRLNGTSMATPHVAGLAALFWEKYPGLTAMEIWQKLEQHAKVLSHHSSRDVGRGMAQAV